MAGSRRSAIFLVILSLLFSILSCDLTQQGSGGGDEPPEDPTPTAAPTFPEEDIKVGMEMETGVNTLPNGQLNYVFQKA